MAGVLPDPFEPVRGALDRVVVYALDQAVATVGRAGRYAVSRASAGLDARVEHMTAVLGRLSHATANRIADEFRGPGARPLTPGETALATEAFGRDPSPTVVRIVAGPGHQPLAASAFLNGNPAITIGNTIYIKPSKYRLVDGQDLSIEPEGAELLLHEYTHVVQYARLGFARFGKRYAAEFRRSGNNADRMYAYGTRRLRYEDEMIEGQAQMVGHYAHQRVLEPHLRNEQLIARLRQRLKGSGIFGQ